MLRGYQEIEKQVTMGPKLPQNDPQKKWKWRKK